MTSEEWIRIAEEKIRSNDVFIAEVHDMVGSDWSRHRTRMENAVKDNEFLRSAIRLLRGKNHDGNT